MLQVYWRICSALAQKNSLARRLPTSSSNSYRFVYVHWHTFHIMYNWVLLCLMLENVSGKWFRNKLVMLMHGIVVGMCPKYLRTIVEPAMPSHPGLRSATCSAPKFVVPRLHTKFSEHAFSFSGPVAWNSLPADIWCTTNRQTFKTLTEISFLPSSFWYFIVTANCLLLGAHVLIVIGALQIDIDDDDDDESNK